MAGHVRSTDHLRLRELLGGYVLGVLASDEDAEVSEHLVDCRACERELVELADSAAGLALADPWRVPEF